MRWIASRAAESSPVLSTTAPRLARLRSRLARLLVGSAILASAGWLALAPRGASVALAEAPQTHSPARTVRFTELRSSPADWVPPLDDAGATDLEEVEETEEPEGPRRYFIRGRFLKRVELLDPQGTVVDISISDFETGRHVSIDPKEKEFTLLDTQVTIQLETGETTEQKIQADPQANLIELFGQVPPAATVQLPPRQIDGQEVVGLQQKTEEKRNGETDTWTRTYWVNARTQRLVRVEISHRSTDKRMGPSDWVQSDFVFDEEMPDALFSTKPPEGHTVKTSPIYGVRL